MSGTTNTNGSATQAGSGGAPQTGRESRPSLAVHTGSNLAEIGKTHTAAQKAATTSTEPDASAVAAARAAAELMRDAGAQTQRMLAHTRETTETVEHGIQDAAHKAAETATLASNTGQQALLRGVGTAADVGYSSSNQLLESFTRVLDVYRDAAERSAAQLEAMAAAGLALGSGMQRMQHGWLATVSRAMSHAERRPQDVFRCRSVTEVAELQRDLYLGMVSTAFDASTTVLDLAARAARDAMLPLQAQHDVSATR